LASAGADDLPGVTATEIRIGNTDAYSGPTSAYGVVAKTEAAFFRMVNDQGGVGDRKINFISYDDAYSPPRRSSRSAAALRRRSPCRPTTSTRPPTWRSSAT
jgi:ABC-type branched-subunit amino acid transport system substrate-binding protein